MHGPLLSAPDDWHTGRVLPGKVPYRDSRCRRRAERGDFSRVNHGQGRPDVGVANHKRSLDGWKSVATGITGKVPIGLRDEVRPSTNGKHSGLDVKPSIVDVHGSHRRWWRLAGAMEEERPFDGVDALAHVEHFTHVAASEDQSVVLIRSHINSA